MSIYAPGIYAAGIYDAGEPALEAVGADQAGAYFIHQPVGADAAGAYTLAQLAGAEQPGAYTVAGVPGVVGADQPGAYAVLEHAGADHPGAYFVHQAVGADQAGAYTLLQAVGAGHAGAYAVEGDAPTTTWPEAAATAVVPRTNLVAVVPRHNHTAIAPPTGADEMQPITTFEMYSQDREVFNINFSARYIPLGDAADRLLAIGHDPGITVITQVPVGGAVPSGQVFFAVDNPEAAGAYKVWAQISTTAGRERTGVVLVNVDTV